MNEDIGPVHGAFSCPRKHFEKSAVAKQLYEANSLLVAHPLPYVPSTS
jgi:hypothetical protein